MTMTDRDPEPIRVGDLVPETLTRLRAEGERLGKERATRKPKMTPEERAAAYAKRYTPGRPIRLHAGLIQEIARKARDGVPIQAAAVASGIPKSTFQSWMKRGREAAEAVSVGREIDSKERIFLEFMLAVEEARSAAMEDAVVAHQRLAFGGEVLEVTENLDEETGEIKSRTIRFSKPDRNALEWYLERSHPDIFGTKRLELTGADGGPISIEEESSAREILKAHLAEVARRIDPENAEAEE